MDSRHLLRDFSAKPDEERHGLREEFDDVPDLYDKARPLYPPALFGDLASLSEIPKHGRILEIGPGTGQATLPLAQAGYKVVAVELGEGLASVARRKLKDFDNASIVVAPFETWDAGEERFDAVVAFTAFHWLDPNIRFKKSAELLTSSGCLAVVTTQHIVRPDSDSFWTNVQEDYDAVDPRDDNRPPPMIDDVEDISNDISESGLFVNIGARRYTWDVTYSAEEYIAVLDTYSGHRALEETKRHDLYDRIRRRIDSQPSACITKTYLAIMNVARKR